MARLKKILIISVIMVLTSARATSEEATSPRANAKGHPPLLVSGTLSVPPPTR